MKPFGKSLLHRCCSMVAKWTYTILSIFLLLFSGLPTYAQGDIANIPDYALRRSLAVLLGKDPLEFPIEIKISELKSLVEATLTGYMVSNDDDDYYVNITDLTGLEHATELTSLTVSRREHVSNLEPIRGLTKLTNLSIISNRLTNVEPIINLTNLGRLELDNNPLVGHSLSVVSNFHNLKVLSLEGTSLEHTGFLRSLTNLTHLDIDHNLVSEISPLSNMTQLVELDLNANQITTVFSHLIRMTNLVSLDLDRNFIRAIEGASNLTKLESLDLMLNEVEDVGELQHLDALIYVNLSGNRLTGISDLQSLGGLQTLDLRGNLLDLSPGTANSNSVATIKQRGTVVQTNPQLLEDTNHPFPDGALRAVVYEYLSVDQGSPLSASQLSSLTSLSSSGPEYVHPRYLTNLTGVQLLTNLSYLHLAQTSAKDLSPLTNSFRLTSLYIFGSELSDISALANLTNLYWMELIDNAISDLSPLTQLKNLRDLNLEDNRISNLDPLAGLTNLNYLDLDHNDILDVAPLESLQKLVFLDLADNKISNIIALSNLTNIQNLDLDENRIADISALSGMRLLYELDLHQNNILSLSAITNLSPRVLDVRGNYLNLAPGSADTNYLSRIAAQNGVVRSEGQRGIEVIYLPIATGLRLRWFDFPQFNFALEQSSTLSTWEPASSSIPIYNNGIWNADVPMNAAAAFYRVRLSTK